MTKQKNPNQRKREIIAAAIELLYEKGIIGFTMDAVVARSVLSKGGVYRFYKNRDDLLTDVFQYLAKSFQPITIEAALSWNLPLKDTLMRLLFSVFYRGDGFKLRRIHMQLMLELSGDEHLLEMMQETFDRISNQYKKIIFAIIERDGLNTTPQFEKVIVSGIAIGQSLFDGLIINSLDGMPIDEIENRMHTFIDLILGAALIDYRAKKIKRLPSLSRRPKKISVLRR
jgi:AcrR family transcriptional regulator